MRHKIQKAYLETSHVAFAAGNVDLSRLVNVVLFYRTDFAKVYITAQHPRLRPHTAKDVFFALAATQMRFVVVRCDG